MIIFFIWVVGTLATLASKKPSQDVSEKSLAIVLAAAWIVYWPIKGCLELSNLIQVIQLGQPK